MYLLLAAAIATLPRLLFRFGGEDPIKGAPFYHEKITREAAQLAGWKAAGEEGTPPGAEDDRSAANGLAWPADNVDTYLYNQVWNAGGGEGRFKAALFAHDDLIKVHFDDLTSTAQINRAWNRYLGGTVAGVLWAMHRDDVAAARHVVGVGLHALQDFYSHSNWVDDPGRRAEIWTKVPPEQRDTLHLYTGTYELDEDFGFKPHGKIALDCTVMQEVVGSDIMDLLCDGFSPLSDTGMCRRWRECKMDSVPTHPDDVFGVPIPADVVWLQPPGIALDNTWLSRISAHNRDLPPTEDPDQVGLALFEAAVKLAGEHSVAWLKELTTIMNGLGEPERAFWEKVRTEARIGDLDGSPFSDAVPSTDADLKQFEQPNKLPLTFLSAGAYPPDPGGADDGWFVRLELHTADDEFGTGTNADIDVVMGGKTFRLDHGSEENRLLEFNDFEDGDQTWYVVGPFAERPTEMTLVNHGAGVGDIVEGAWEDLKSILGDLLKRIETFLLSLFGGNADYVGSDKLTRSWAELLDIAASGGQDYELRCAGDGVFKVHGRITATAQPNGSLRVSVHPQVLECVEESKIDQTSGDDEPFLLQVVNSPAANQLVKGRSKVFQGVDSGESRDLEMPATEVDVPRHGGLIVANALWESDDEDSDDRDDLLNKFAERYGEGTDSFRSQFLDAIGEAVLPDWKLASFDAYAYRRGHLTRTAHLAANRKVDQWIEAGGKLTLGFDDAPTRTVLVPSLRPATESRTLLPGGNIAAVAVGNGTVYASVGPQVVEGTPPGPGTLHRLGQHLEPGTTTTVAPGARSLAVDPVHKRLYAVTMNDSVRRYDPETLQQLAAAPIGFGAWDVAVAPGGTLVYVSRWRVAGGAVFVLKADDLSQLALLTKSPTTPAFHGTFGLAADPDGKRAYVARSFRADGPDGLQVAGHSLIVARPAGGFAVVDSTLSEPLIQPVDVAVDAPAGLVFLACLGGGGVHPRLLILNRGGIGVPTLQGTVVLPGAARAVAALPGSGMAYVATDDGLCLVDGKARTLELTLPLGPAPSVIAVDPDTGATFVGDRVDGTVRRVDTAAILG